MRTSERKTPNRRFSILRSHFATSKPLMAISPRTLLVLAVRFGGNIRDSATVVKSRVFPFPSSPNTASISPFLHWKLAPRIAHERLVAWADHKSRTAIPALGLTDPIAWKAALLLFDSSTSFWVLTKPAWNSFTTDASFPDAITFKSVCQTNPNNKTWRKDKSNKESQRKIDKAFESAGVSPATSWETTRGETAKSAANQPYPTMRRMFDMLLPNELVSSWVETRPARQCAKALSTDPFSDSMLNRLALEVPRRDHSSALSKFETPASSSSSSFALAATARRSSMPGSSVQTKSEKNMEMWKENWIGLSIRLRKALAPWDSRE
mmetsp:Transcript_6849/g.16691  ORF Transcript_6849/g.16691 Transcript_6849/m.16691 type:complete len:323 (-) Transcript_6849:783-1751(-)